MKSRTLPCITAMTLLTTLAVPVGLAAREEPTTQEQKPAHRRYKLIDVGTLGGPFTSIIDSEQMLLNNGTLTGESDTSIPDPYAPNCFVHECLVQRAFRWQDGVLTDLGALAGGGSSNSGWINSRGWIAGISQNGTIDPLTGVPETRAVLWKDNEITDLGTLGGYESGAVGMNNGGQVVGAATNLVPDPFSFFQFKTQLRAFLWERGEMHDLGTLGGPDAFAQYINDQGEVAGFSYTSYTPNPVTGIPQIDPFLWENGRMIDLGNLGGTNAGTFGPVFGLNNRGQVVGVLALPGDTVFHPFLWDNGTLTDLGTFGGPYGQANWINGAGETVGYALYPDNFTVRAALWTNGQIHDLGTLPGQGCSAANAINSNGQIIGLSFPCNVFTPSAVLWEHGSIVDLNTLVPSNSGLHLEGAHAINDRGEIECGGVLPNGDSHAVLLIPCAEGDEGCGQSAAGTGATQVNSARVTGRASPVTPTNPAVSDGPGGMLNLLRARRFPGRRPLGPATRPAN
jgi:probable HAF family extracellular repeat protein